MLASGSRDLFDSFVYSLAVAVGRSFVECTLKDVIFLCASPEVWYHRASFLGEGLGWRGRGD